MLNCYTVHQNVQAQFKAIDCTHFKDYLVLYSCMLNIERVVSHDDLWPTNIKKKNKRTYSLIYGCAESAAARALL